MYRVIAHAVGRFISDTTAQSLGETAMCISVALIGVGAVLVNANDFGGNAQGRVLPELLTPQSFFVGILLLTQLMLTILIARSAKRSERAAQQALVQSESRFRDLYENASDVIFTLDLMGRFTSVNKTTERITGYSAGEILGQTIDALLSKGDAALVHTSILSKLGGEEPSMLEMDVRAKNGHKIALEMTGRLLANDGTPIGLQVIGRDVTARKRTDNLLHDRRQILQLIAENATMERILAHLVETVERHLPTSTASIWRVHGDRVEIVAAPGLPEACRKVWGTLAIGPDQCSAGTATSLRQPVVVESIAETDLWKHHSLSALAYGFLASAAVPVRSSDKVVGVVEVYHGAPHQVDRSEMEVLETVADLTSIAFDQQALRSRLAHLAHHDWLTGLPNRLSFEERLESAIEDARRYGRMIAILYVDLDRFKIVNDTLGHTTGDAVLKQVARRFSRRLRKSDTLARAGGDEFTIILSDLACPENAISVATKLAHSLKKPTWVRGKELFVSASIGVAVYPADGQDSAALQQNADIAMYCAKRKGGGRAERYGLEIKAAIDRQLAIANELHHALTRGEMLLHYQPQFDLATGRLSGLEALLRWIHPKMGLIPPKRFIPIAEDCGLISELTDWVLDEVCAQNHRWQRDGYEPLKIAVNIGASQFARANLVGRVARILCTHNLDPSCLELELTESAIMEDLDTSIRQMARLRALGVGLSIDDFGTGYSALSYLQSLPVNNLKVDQSFLQVLDEVENTGPVIQGIVDLAHGLGLTVTAEGVERESQLSLLRSMGCDTVQGYWLGHPMPACMVTELLIAPQKTMASCMMTPADYSLRTYAFSSIT
jgi:diguanylate cyclase (GGDEF)-like protein/PAS domain S-box-containing protein